jgi:hypothetical protein
VKAGETLVTIKAAACRAVQASVPVEGFWELAGMVAVRIGLTSPAIFEVDEPVCPLVEVCWDRRAGMVRFAIPLGTTQSDLHRLPTERHPLAASGHAKTPRDAAAEERPKRPAELTNWQRVTVWHPSATRPALAVPEDCVVRLGQSNEVLVHTGIQELTPRSVVLGERRPGWVEVIEGLAAGEEVVRDLKIMMDLDERLAAIMHGFWRPPWHQESKPAPEKRIRIKLPPPTSVQKEGTLTSGSPASRS